MKEEVTCYQCSNTFTIKNDGSMEQKLFCSDECLRSYERWLVNAAAWLKK